MANVTAHPAGVVPSLGRALSTHLKPVLSPSSALWVSDSPIDPGMRAAGVQHLRTHRLPDSLQDPGQHQVGTGASTSRTGPLVTLFGCHLGTNPPGPRPSEGQGWEQPPRSWGLQGNMRWDKSTLVHPAHSSPGHNWSSP